MDFTWIREITLSQIIVGIILYVIIAVVINRLFDAFVAGPLYDQGNWSYASIRGYRDVGSWVWPITIPMVIVWFFIKTGIVTPIHWMFKKLPRFNPDGYN